MISLAPVSVAWCVAKAGRSGHSGLQGARCASNTLSAIILRISSFLRGTSTLYATDLLLLDTQSRPNQSLEPTAGRCTERLKDEVKAKLAAASGGSAPSR